MSAIIDSLSVELMLKIAGYLDQPSLASLSRVSKSWTPPANDILWSHLENLSSLLRLLPRRLEGGVWVPETPISATTLTKFDEFASRVRVVDWSETGWINDTAWLTIFAELAQLVRATRPGQPLLPNVRSFRAYCQTSHGVSAIVPWLSSSASLKAVDITLGHGVDDRASTYFLLAVADNCATQLTSFSLRMDHSSFAPKRYTVQALLPLFQRLEAVKKVVVPLYASPGQHLDALGALPHLEELSLSLIEPPGGHPSPKPIIFLPLWHSYPDIDLNDTPHIPVPTTTIDSIPTTPTAKFPRLSSLAIAGSFLDIVDVIRLTTHNLERLSLVVPFIQFSQEMTRAMRDIVAFYPRLAFIDIDIFTVADDHHVDWVDWNPLILGQQRPLVISIRHQDLADALVIDLPSQAT